MDLADKRQLGLAESTRIVNWAPKRAEIGRRAHWAQPEPKKIRPITDRLESWSV